MRNNININKINLIGLGKLGACMAVCFADAGFKILGYDINEDTVSTLKKYKSHIVEKDFQKYLSKSKKNLNFTSNIDDLSSHSFLSFIIVSLFMSSFVRISIRNLSAFSVLAYFTKDLT